MSYMEELNARFVDRFTIEVNSLVADLKDAYSKKFPFVACILVGNGTASVYDRDEINMHETNWGMVDEMKATDPERHEDAIYEQLDAERRAADTDPFIQFLCDIQTHPMYDGTINDIHFK